MWLCTTLSGQLLLLHHMLTLHYKRWKKAGNKKEKKIKKAEGLGLYQTEQKIKSSESSLINSLQHNIAATVHQQQIS